MRETWRKEGSKGKEEHKGFSGPETVKGRLVLFCLLASSVFKLCSCLQQKKERKMNRLIAFLRKTSLWICIFP